MCLGFVQNFAGFVAVRALLGVAEGGLLPGMVCFQYCTELTLVIANKEKKVLYLSSFYRRGDLALRIGLFYTAASLSGAFGGTYASIYFVYFSAATNKLGLLARGLAEIGPRGGIEGWRWILIIEGLLVCEDDFY